MLKNGNRSYQEASRAIQNNLQKHIESDKFQWSDSDEEASDDDHAEQLDVFWVRLVGEPLDWRAVD